ncbi:hypothetical protein GGS21DRAFT_436899 [Xylaria nigripes]|nr:hypothetical protein GGS21DRAFT_436899 [Xylaria nigripes]
MSSDKGTRPQAALPRKLFKGTLSPPCPPSTSKSYTLTPAPSAEVFIRDPAEKSATSQGYIAISSTAVPQPFVDPTALQRRSHPS